jgi:hypothetical protein
MYLYILICSRTNSPSKYEAFNDTLQKFSAQKLILDGCWLLIGNDDITEVRKEISKSLPAGDGSFLAEIFPSQAEIEGKSFFDDQLAYILKNSGRDLPLK